MAESWTWVNPRLADPPPPRAKETGPRALIALGDPLERETLAHALGYLEWDATEVKDLAEALAEAERCPDPSPAVLIADAASLDEWLGFLDRLPKTWASSPKILVRNHPDVSSPTAQSSWTTLVRPLNLADIVAALGPDPQP